MYMLNLYYIIIYIYIYIYKKSNSVNLFGPLGDVCGRLCLISETFCLSAIALQCFAGVDHSDCIYMLIWLKAFTLTLFRFAVLPKSIVCYYIPYWSNHFILCISFYADLLVYEFNPCQFMPIIHHHHTSHLIPSMSHHSIPSIPLHSFYCVLFHRIPSNSITLTYSIAFAASQSIPIHSISSDSIRLHFNPSQSIHSIP